VETHLLLESDIIERAEGVRLVLGAARKDSRNPLFGEDKPWEPRFDNLYPNVIFDEADGVYKLWYNPFIIDERVTNTPAEDRRSLAYVKAVGRRETGLCYATSRDGIAWEKPELGLVEFDGSERNNLVMRRIHGPGVFVDMRDPDAARRYKMLGVDENTKSMAVGFSPDGLHWPPLIQCPAIDAAGDTHNNALWDESAGRYAGITRLWIDRQRIVGRTESADFVNWTKAEEVLRGDPENQTYAMPVFRYAGVFLGLVMILHADQTVDCELAWSRDTRNWERVCPGTPLIPRGEKGAHDYGCIYAAAYPIARDDDIRLYYLGSDDTHISWRKGFFCLAHLRPDGFACMRAARPGELGVLVTRPLTFDGGALEVNVDASEGECVIELLDGDERPIPGFLQAEARPLRGIDGAALRATWKGKRDLSSLAGRAVRVKFHLRDACLYAFRL
jgi:hypothetical protein